MAGDIVTTDKLVFEALDLMKASRPDEALPLLTRALAFDPENDAAYDLFIEAHMQLKRFDRVVRLVDEGIAQNRPAGLLLVWKALAHAEMSELEEAEIAARQAIEHDIRLDTAVVALSTVLVRQNRGEDALRACQAFMQKHPENEVVACHEIEVASQLDLFDQVVDRALAYMRRFGKDPTVLDLLGTAYIDLGDLRKADRAFRTAAMLDPDVAEHHCNVILTAHLLGDAPTAENYLEKLGKRDAELASQVKTGLDEFFSGLDEEHEPE